MHNAYLEAYQLITRQAKDIARAKAGLEAYHEDWRYKYLYDRVSDFFAEILISDLRLMDGGEVENISMAAKFCPSIDSIYDKATLVCEIIAKKVFPRDVYAEPKDIEEAHYAYSVRHRLQKEVLVPLRKALEKSKEINKAPVKSLDSTFVAMKAYKKLAVEPDEKKKFKQHLKIVDKYGKWTDDDGILLPHQVFILMNKKYELAELYWQRMRN